MNRRKFITSASAMAVAATTGTTSASTLSTGAVRKQFYEWQKYNMIGSPAKLDAYFRDVLIPYYNTRGVKIGAFGSYGMETPAVQYYLFVYPDAETYWTLKKSIWKDDKFMAASKTYFTETAANPIYTNVEISVCEAFDALPQLKQPGAERTLFEFRTYWSPNEEANQRKIHMFNNGEIDIFNDCNVNSVFYGEILAGPRMNALMYLTWYKDMNTRNDAWAKFGAHPKWNEMKSMDRYKNTATNNSRIFLVPLPYSQI